MRPSQCAVCHDWGDGRLCALCLSRFAQTVFRCRRCAAPVPGGVEVCGGCLIEPPPFQRTIAAVSYAPPWNWLIHEFKFRNALDLADSLATLLLQAQSLQADTLPSLMVPMPLNAARLRERGYNQSWELARRCAPRLGCQTDSALLIRIKDTSRQASLSREQRAINMRGAFAVEPMRRSEIRGRAITLVDDVMTTQATAAEAARTLLAAGALSVDVWVVARTSSTSSP